MFVGYWRLPIGRCSSSDYKNGATALIRLMAISLRYGENLSVHPSHPRHWEQGEKQPTVCQSVPAFPLRTPGWSWPLRRSSLRTLPYPFVRASASRGRFLKDRQEMRVVSELQHGKACGRCTAGFIPGRGQRRRRRSRTARFQPTGPTPGAWIRLGTWRHGSYDPSGFRTATG